ncbi:MAG: heat-inducible transcription repressor HrcA [Ruminococcaceae bacterium]|nr:heat-inducible transcription repressor HrcA [Oscillospiraceae bacterium]
MELTDRKKQILKIVVDGYIATAEPMGSKAIAEKMTGKISSATIRNELADLVELGYLEQPHTSAGRIPSPKGYRLYVNELMEQRTLSAEETASINASLSGKMAQVDQVVSQAGQMVSRFVGYPSYAMTEGKREASVRRFELIAVDEDSCIAVVMLSDSRVKSQLLRVTLPVAQDALPEMSHLLNTHFTAIDAAEISARLMNLSDQVSGNWFLLLNQVCDYARELLQEATHQSVFTTGTSQLLKFPEYRDVDKAHELMSFMVDNKENLPIPAGDSPMQILIGPENVNEALKESSVVIASYDIGDNMRGLVGVVGPTRMDYATVAARLSYFAESLSRMFGAPHQLPAKEEPNQ